MKTTHTLLPVLAVLVMTATDALAISGGGGSRVPLTDWLIELYGVTNNVYVPLLCLAALVLGAANLLFGFLRFGPVFGRILAVVGILGLGISWFANILGARAVTALLWLS